MSAEPKVKLFTYALSPFGMKVYWTLVYKRIPFELVYVHPADQRQISFTKQQIVPVLQIGDEWKLNSADICIWLDQVFPERRVSGEDDACRDAILSADDWVTENIYSLDFRSYIDREEAKHAFHNGRILGRTMRQTSGGVWLGLEYVWPYLLRRSPFIQREATRIDPGLSSRAHRERIAEEFESRIAKSGFLAGSNSPSIADMSAFASMAAARALDLRGGLISGRTPTLCAWFDRMLACIPNMLAPDLVPGRSFV